jgi:hypothetical protein
MINEFMGKRPDTLFHFLLRLTTGEDFRTELARIFEPLSHCISDPDPVMLLNPKLKNAV